MHKFSFIWLSLILVASGGCAQEKPRYVDILDFGSECSSYATVETKFNGVGGGSYRGTINVQVNGEELGEFEKGGHSTSLYRFFQGSGGKISITFQTVEPIYVLIRRLDLKTNTERVLFKNKFEPGNFESSLTVDKNGLVEMKNTLTEEGHGSVNSLILDN